MWPLYITICFTKRSNQSNLMIRKWWSSIFQTNHNLYERSYLFRTPAPNCNAPMSVINRSIFKILESFCRFSIVLSWFVNDRKPTVVSFTFSFAGGMSLHITTKWTYWPLPTSKLSLHSSPDPCVFSQLNFPFHQFNSTSQISSGIH